MGIRVWFTPARSSTRSDSGRLRSSARKKAASRSRATTTRSRPRTISGPAALALENADFYGRESVRAMEMQRLVASMTRGEHSSPADLDDLALEWLAVGPVEPAVHDALFARFNRCRQAAER